MDFSLKGNLYFQDSFSDDSDLDERIMQHLAAASSRTHYVRRRERQRYSGLGASHGFAFPPHENVSGLQQAHPTSPEERPSLGYGSPRGDSPTSPRPPVVQPPPSFLCSTAANNDVPLKPRYAPRARSNFLMWTCMTLCYFLAHTLELDIYSTKHMN